MTVIDQAAVGERLRRLRQAKRQTQVDFAKAVDIGRQLISGIESGCLNLTVENAVKLCGSCRVTLDWLYFGKSNSNVPDDVIEALRKA